MGPTTLQESEWPIEKIIGHGVWLELSSSFWPKHHRYVHTTFDGATYVLSGVITQVLRGSDTLLRFYAGAGVQDDVGVYLIRLISRRAVRNVDRYLVLSGDRWPSIGILTNIIELSIRLQLELPAVCPPWKDKE